MVAHAEGSALLVFMLGLLRGLLKFLLLLNEESFGIEIRHSYPSHLLNFQWSRE